MVAIGRLVRVIVQDDTGRGIGNAEVTIAHGPELPNPPKDITDASGTLGMRFTAVGQYEFVCVADGYETSSLSVMITDDAVSIVTITLRPFF